MNPFMEQRPAVLLSDAAREACDRERLRRLQDARPMPSLTSLIKNSPRNKALIVGVNYAGSESQLKGCVNDAHHVKIMLEQYLRYTKAQVRFLTDGENGIKTKIHRAANWTNILAGLNWLIAGALSGDQLLFYFSGYGAQHPQFPGAGGHEAYLLPSDYLGDEVPGEGEGYRLLAVQELMRAASQLPQGVKFTIILDCAYAEVPGLGGTNGALATFPKVARGKVNYKKLQDYVSRPRFLEIPARPFRHVQLLGKPIPAPRCIVHALAASRLVEFNAEMPLEGTVQGALTFVFIKALAGSQFNVSWQQLYQVMSSLLSDLRTKFQGVEQTPVLHLSRTASASDKVLVM